MRSTKAKLLRANLLGRRAPLLGGPPRGLPTPEVRIEAVVARARIEAAGIPAMPWRCPDAAPPLIPLSAQVRPADVALVVRALCVHHRVPAAPSAEQTLHDLLDVDALTLAGGLSFLVDGVRVVTPGCCAGLEHWRSWGDLLTTGTAPWGGHDPFASAMVADGAVHVFSDAGVDPRLVLERGTYASLLLDVERDLLLFLRRLEAWAKETAPSCAQALVSMVARDWKIVAMLPS